MTISRYALVTYVRNPVGQFVEDLRRELHPETAHLAAHLTVLPPRELRESEAATLEFLEEACSGVVPFDLTLGDVETFLPATPTVFIQVTQAAYRMRELHDHLGVKSLRCEEEWPYIPHLTIIKTKQDEQARAAWAVAKERWSQFQGPRQIHIEDLMFVQQNGDDWRDVASVPLGRSQLSSRP